MLFSGSHGFGKSRSAHLDLSVTVVTILGGRSFGFRSKGAVRLWLKKPVMQCTCDAPRLAWGDVRIVEAPLLLKVRMTVTDGVPL